MELLIVSGDRIRLSEPVIELVGQLFGAVVNRFSHIGVVLVVVAIVGRCGHVIDAHNMDPRELITQLDKLCADLGCDPQRLLGQLGSGQDHSFAGIGVSAMGRQPVAVESLNPGRELCEVHVSRPESLLVSNSSVATANRGIPGASDRADR